MRQNIWSSQVNGVLGLLFVGSFALGAGLIIWHAASGQNPVAQEMTSYLTASTQGE